MKDFYIRFGRRFPIPPTVQIKHEIMHVVLNPPQSADQPVAIPSASSTQ